MKILTILIAVLSSAPAFAHIMPDHTEPKVGSTVKAPPKEVKIWYDGPVGVDKSHVEITDESGNSLVCGKLRGDEKDKTELIIPISTAHGKLKVKWDAYCPDCDHTTHGTFEFTVAP